MLPVMLIASTNSRNKKRDKFRVELGEFREKFVVLSFGLDFMVCGYG
jgi:hypothetical protein